jgi:asparagine synthase (glutamine-hydrolysing)
MIEAGHPQLRTYTIGIEDDEADESAAAERYARELGIEQVVEHITPQAALALLPDVVAAASEPFGDYSIFPTMLVSRLASRDFKVMLSGDGGDELFWGYPQRSAELIRFAPTFRIPYPLRRLRSLLPRYRGDGEAPALTNMTLGDWYERRHTRMRGRWLARIFPDLPALPADFRAFEFASRDRDETAAWLRWNEFSYHLTMVLLKVDRASMHFSQEVRVPLLDRAVIDIAHQVDWRACLDLDSLTGKLPLRRSLARYVSSQTQAKKGFEAPMAEWLRGPLRERFEQLVLAPGELLGQAVDVTALRALYAEHRAGHRDHARGLWPLLSLALWSEHHLHRPACGSSCAADASDSQILK